MKTIKYFVFAFLATFVLAGCTDDLTYDRGGNEDPNCYGVYFPSQADTDKELDPDDPTEAEFTIARTKDEDAITVPVVVSSNKEGLFTVEPISFEAGQTETKFKVSFKGAEIGITYTCNIRVEDPAYASIYGGKSSGLDFTVTRVKWNLLTGPNGETKGKWRDDIVSSLYNVPVKYAENDQIEIYERADMPGYYRILDLYSPEYLSVFYPDYSPSDLEENCTRGIYTYINATDKTKVWLAEQSTGVTLNSGDGVIGYASMVTENGFNGNAYGTMVNGIITFPTQGILLSLGGEGWYYGNRTGMQRIMLPGAMEHDYSFSIDKSEPKDGKVELDLTLGADITKVTYQIFEGSLSATLAASKSSDMDAGVIESEELTASKTLSLEMDETGIYTIVANVYDVDGALQSFKYLPFGYIKAGDDMPVLFNLGLIVSDKYASEGYTAEDAAEFWANGQEIESGYYALYETDALAGATEEDLIKALKANAADTQFTDEDIADINEADGSFGILFGGLNGGTSYTLVAYVYNGYVSKLFAAEATTEGTPHPLKRNYTISDFMAEQLSKAEMCKTWNYYAGTISNNVLSGKRAKVGTVTISDNTTADTEDADYLDISGLTGLASYIGGDDTMLIEYYNGVLYSISDQIIGSYDGEPVSYWMTTTTLKAYSVDYALLGGQVDDGYIAFVGNPNYISQNGLTFDGMRFLTFSDESLGTATGGLRWYYNLMLEDPGKAIPMSAPSAAVSKLQLEKIAAAFAQPQNCVELRGRERLHALIDEYVGRDRTPVNVAQPVMHVERSDAQVANAKVTFASGKSEVSGPVRMIGVKADIRVK